MVSRQGRCGVYVAVLAAFFHCLCARQSSAAGFEFESAGVRGGVSDNANFNQIEALVDWNLPWHLDWASDWHLQTKLDSSFGWIYAEGRDAAIGTVGPGALLKYDKVPISLEGSFCPTFMTRSKFGTKDL